MTVALNVMRRRRRLTTILLTTHMKPSMTYTGLSLRTTNCVQVTVNDKCCLLALTCRNTVTRKMKEPSETNTVRSHYENWCS